MYYSIFIDFQRTETKAHYQTIRLLLSFITEALQSKIYFLSWAKDPRLENLIVIYIRANSTLTDNCINSIVNEVKEEFKLPKCQSVKSSFIQGTFSENVEEHIFLLNRAYGKLDDEKEIVTRSILDLYKFLQPRCSKTALEKVLRSQLKKVVSYHSPVNAEEKLKEMEHLYLENRIILIKRIQSLKEKGIEPAEIYCNDEKRDETSSNCRSNFFNIIDRLLCGMPYDRRYNLYVVYILWALAKENIEAENKIAS